MITFTRSEWTQKFKEVFLHLRLVHPPYFHVTDSGVTDFDSGKRWIVALVVNLKLIGVPDGGAGGAAPPPLGGTATVYEERH